MNNEIELKKVVFGNIKLMRLQGYKNTPFMTDSKEIALLCKSWMWRIQKYGYGDDLEYLNRVWSQLIYESSDWFQDRILISELRDKKGLYEFIDHGSSQNIKQLEDHSEKCEEGLRRLGDMMKTLKIGGRK